MESAVHSVVWCAPIGALLAAVVVIGQGVELRSGAFWALLMLVVGGGWALSALVAFAHVRWARFGRDRFWKVEFWRGLRSRGSSSRPPPE